MNEQEKALARAYQAQYARKWRKQNPEKQKLYKERHMLKKGLEMQEEWNEAFRGGADNANQ